MAVETLEKQAEIPALAEKKAAAAVKISRLASLDAYRGFAMVLMASDGLKIGEVARHFKDSAVWQFMAFQTDHVAWSGCALWDLIQPSFMFMSGVSLPYSVASRREKGHSFASMFLHVLWRSLLLILLGIFLRSVGRKQTYFIFTDVLTQIGLGYPFLFALAWLRPRWQFLAAASILFLYWLAFALYPLPSPQTDFSKLGIPADWAHLQGFAAHWDKNTNLAAHFDQWWLNLFPREKPFVFSEGGYQTLSFIPSLATMILGLLAGELLRGERPAMQKFWILSTTGIACLVLGSVLDATGVCPSVKRIWTPAWTVYSSGWTFLLLGSFYFVIDVKGWQRWAFPLLVVGMNSIAMYVMAHLCPSLIRESIKTHLGQNTFELWGYAKNYAPMLETVSVLFVMWLVCLWMYRRKIFLRI